MSSNSLIFALKSFVRGGSIPRLIFRTECLKLNADQLCRPMREFSSISNDYIRQPYQVLRLSLDGNIPTSQNNLIVKRYKKTKRPSSKSDNDEPEDDGDDEEENPMLMEDESIAEDCEQMTIDVNSLRLDAVTKVAFASTRTKIEESFYKGEIYVNGEKPLKKSHDLSIGDEVDMIKNPNAEDPAMVDIRRIQVIDLPDKASQQGRIKIGIKRWSNLTIEPHDKQSN